MGLSFGSLGISSIRRASVNTLYDSAFNGDHRTAFCAIVGFIVVLLLAYLTNPSEASFRTFLTEQSFRHYLSRLDEDPCHTDSRHRGSGATRGFSTAILHHDRAREPPPPPGTAPPSFRFASRASISLRTPRHVFRSLGVCTIAAVVPEIDPETDHDHDELKVLDCLWFVGAFGRWWYGTILDSWYRDVVVPTKNKGYRSGLLDIKAPDRLNDYNGLPFSNKPTLPLSRGTPPRLRNRERPSQRQLTPNVHTTRSTTPPPLPQSASLPLHATRSPISSAEKTLSVYPAQQRPPAQEPSAVLEPDPPATTRSRAPSLSTLDKSPVIAEVLRQMTRAKASVHDLRAQYAALQASAQESHAVLKSEVDLYRERKKTEDVARAEIKLRTKTLEDNRRNAENGRRDAEKRLKVAETKRDDADKRIQFLNKEIDHLRNRLQTLSASLTTPDKTEEGDLTEALNRKRREAKVAEDVVAALNIRAKELEEKVAEGREKLQAAREQAEIKRRERDHAVLQQFTSQSSDSDGLWPSINFTPLIERSDVFPSPTPGIVNLELPKSPRRPRLSLSSTSNTDAYPAFHRSRGHSIISDDTLSPVRLRFNALDIHNPRINFSPFDTDDLVVPSRMSAAALTTNLRFPTLEGADSPDPHHAPLQSSRSFQSDSDSVLDRSEWKATRSPRSPVIMSTSPSTVHPQIAEVQEDDPFEVRFPQDRPRRTLTDPYSPNPEFLALSVGDATSGSGPRRWHSASATTKKGLNPDAKVFRLPSRASSTSSPGIATPAPTYDALNPNGLSSGMMSVATPATALIRAFAPSPAEREALKRALGGSNNVSLEKLPTLPDVGTIAIPKTSPPLVHALVSQTQQQQQQTRHHSQHPQHPHPQQRHHHHTQSEQPAWMQKISPVGRTNFSPWEDEAYSAAAARESNEEGVQAL